MRRVFRLPSKVGGASCAATLISLIAAASLAALLITLGAFNWPTADDFCNEALVETRGFGGAVHWFYFEWSGRLATGILAYAIFSVVGISGLRVVSMLLAAGLVLVAGQISSFISPGSARIRWPVAAFALMALTLGLYPLLGQVVFWPSGGLVYLWPLILLLYWLLSMRALLRDGNERPGNLHGFVVSAILASSIELVVPIVASYVGVMMLRRWSVLARSVRRAMLIRAAGILVGATVLIAAPGNYLRADATPGSLHLEPRYLIEQYAKMLESSMSAGAVLLGIAAGLLLVALLLAILAPQRDGDADRSRRPFRRDEIMALIVGAALSMVPVLAAPAQFAPRNSLYAMVCILVTALLALEPWINGQSSARAVSMLLALVACLGTLMVGHTLLEDLHVAAARLPAQLARDQLLRDAAAAGRKHVIVAPIAAPWPASMHSVDIGADPKQLLNWCVATSYHLESVAAEGGNPP